MKKFQPSNQRYNTIKYNRCGKSGLMLPAISLGLWHNFGHVDNPDNAKQIILKAFDNGITHFDLANNYGPPPGSAEENFGKILNSDLKSYRDELIISSKAGYMMWDGPYGEWGSKKYLIASLDQSLKRLGLDYLDIFYSHRPDPNTPIEETVLALDQIVKSGKALYIGLSNYSPEKTSEAIKLFEELRTPFIIHQPKYNMFLRDIEDGLLDVLEEKGKGCIVFSPLNQGILSDKYIKGIPENSRAGKAHGFLQKSQITPEIIDKVIKLNAIAIERGQSLSQMAISWILRLKGITSVLVGVSSISQLMDNLKSIDNLEFSKEELDKIERIL